MNAVLREDRQENQQNMSNQDTTQVEVVSGSSALYLLIEQRRDSLPRDLNDELESDSDESIIEDTTWHNTLHNEPAEPYDQLVLSSNPTSW